MIKPYKFDLAERENSRERRALYESWKRLYVREDSGDGSPRWALNKAGGDREQIEAEVEVQAKKERPGDEQWFETGRRERLRKEWLPNVVERLAAALRPYAKREESLGELIHNALKADGHADDLGVTVEMIGRLLVKRPGRRS
jgi:hypothetical protein